MPPTPGTSGDAKPEKDIIERNIGTFGRWHMVITLTIFLVKFPIAWHQISIVIEGPPVGNFSCSDPTLDKCDEKCPKHVFDRSIFTETILTQFDLVCKKAFLASLTQTIAMLGILFGNMVFGIASDKCGRRYPLVIAVTIQLISGTACAFIPNYWVYLVFRFLTTFVTGGTMITSFVLTMELIGMKWRTTVGILYQIPFYLGHLTLAPIGYLLRDWRHQQLALSLPSTLLLSYYCLMPESPRWLLALNRTEKAIKVLENFAAKNKLPTEQIRGEVTTYIQNKKDTSAVRAGNITDLFRTPNIRKNWFCISYNWIVCGLCYFGVAQYMGHIAGNIFLNIASSAMITIPGTFYSVWSMHALGRRNTLIIANLIAGVPFLVIAFVPEKYELANTLLGTISLFGLSICFSTVYIYNGELFPTVIRNIGVGTSSMCARIGSMIAPFVTGLHEFVQWAPPIVYFIVPVIGAILCSQLPETLNCKLPDTIEEAEAIMKMKKQKPET